MTLLSVRAAQRRIKRILSVVETETVEVTDALGRVLASDITSAALPRFSNSSVDGFAVIAADVRNAGPRTPRRLSVVADIPAGTYSRVHLRRGQAARIMTGAPVPAGANAVVMLEDTDAANAAAGSPAPAAFAALKEVSAGTNVRLRGSDARSGTILLRPGHRIRAQDLGLLTMLDRKRVRVYRKPRVALLSSGNELIASDRPLPPGGIRDTNSVTLASLLNASGCEVIRLGVARDSRASIRSLLDRAVAREADLIVSSAGVSVGALDLVRDVLEQRGELHFWKVNVRPGKPLAVGRYRRVPFLGLPGNPVSAFVGFALFVQPAIDLLSGEGRSRRPRFRVTLAEPIKSDGRESYLRAVVVETPGSYRAKLTGHQGSGNLLSLVQANALLMIPAGVKSLAVGAQVDAWWL